MCEKPDTETSEATAETGPTELAIAVDLSCFDADEITRLVAARNRHDEGTLNEDPTVYRRLRFVRWLHDQGQYAA
jgi:hypothetical protein